MTEILMPALSPTMEEGTLAKWLVNVGDTVKAGDVIAEIETDKATMEVEAVDEGVVEHAFDYLDAPPLRVACEDVPMPYAANLEVLALPSVDKVVAAVKTVMNR